ncbi:MAG: aminoacetone oxidase family FAD-binding enzyme [Alphaproteobacteria bacterium]|nr:aminoacetone oxidase family FAD-binding enzyme [Alphaproteobacteria bacterium]
MTTACDVLVIGAGAAGMMCAIEAAKRGRRVAVLDHAKAAGEKIRISGGGRCNFTNIHSGPANFLSGNPHFCKSALSRYSPRDFIALVEKHGIAWHEKTLGQLFCDVSAKLIIRMLLDEMAAAGAALHLETAVTGIEKTGDGFAAQTTRGAFACQSLVIATGGLSIPKMGATGFAHDVARQFGLNIIPARAGLVPLLFDDDLLALTKPLSGVSVDPAVVSCGKTSFREALLFTHRGLSGPAILQISSYWHEGEDIVIDLLPGRDVFGELKQKRQDKNKAMLHNALAEAALPRRLADLIAARTGVDAPLTDLSDAKLRAVADHIHRWRIPPIGTEGYRTAEVTLGGVDTDELSSKTMESRKTPGLYFIGEAVDVTGHLGGHNFQWAWASGWCAGQFA